MARLRAKFIDADFLNEIAEPGSSPARSSTGSTTQAAAGARSASRLEGVCSAVQAGLRFDPEVGG